MVILKRITTCSPEQLCGAFEPLSAHVLVLQTADSVIDLVPSSSKQITYCPLAFQQQAHKVSDMQHCNKLLSKYRKFCTAMYCSS